MIHLTDVCSTTSVTWFVIDETYVDLLFLNDFTKSVIWLIDIVVETNKSPFMGVAIKKLGSLHTIYIWHVNSK